MPWKSNELLGAAQKLLDIYGNSAHAATLIAAGVSVTALTTALTTEKGGYSTAEELQRSFRFHKWPDLLAGP